MNKIKLKSINGVMLILSIIGLIDSIYLSSYHYLGVPLVCSTSGIINCNNVINSPYGYIFGVPVAFYGVIFFVLEIILLLFIKDILKKVVLNIIGLGSVFYFFYAEYMVGNICEYCTLVHITVIILLSLSLYQYIKEPEK